MRKTLLYVMLACMGLCSCHTERLSERIYNKGVNVIPAPELVEQGKGMFVLDEDVTIGVSHDSILPVASFYAQKMRVSTGYGLPLEESGAIRLSIDKTVAGDEAYRLSVTPDGVDVRASSLRGLFYGMATFMQLLPAEIESTACVDGVEWTVPEVEVVDSPRFPYRGLMLDVTRHFISVEGLKKHMDMLASVKINTLHLHLSDYQGWRVEIKKYPRLTEVGARRIDEYGKEYSGYYTQDDIREIVEYARQRFITVIPEIDVPGHSLAAIAAYPELSCTGENYEVMSRWGRFPVVFCPGKEVMFEMLDDIFAEMCALFPGPYFHIGGDECPKEVWKTCPHCQQRVREEGLWADSKHSSVDKLQSYAIARCERILKKYGKKMIGWDEILEGGLAPDATVMSWRGESGGIASALMDHDVIMTPASGGMYLDYYQGNAQAEPFAWGGYVPISKTYSYNPVPDTLVRMGKEQYILGVQANAWAECMYTEDIVEYQVYPRILAVAEVGWTPWAKKDFADFSRRLDNAAVRMDCRGINYHIPVPEQPDYCRNHVAFTDSVVVQFSTSRPMKMVYTLDGTEPGPGSAVYTEPLVFRENGLIKIRSVLPSGRMGIVREVEVERQTFLPASGDEPKHEGLHLRFSPTRCLYVSQLNDVRDWKDSVLTSIEPIVKLRKNKYSGVEFYVAVAEGYFYVPEDGIYEFSSNNTRITIGGKLAVDNDGKPQVNSKYGRSLALRKGWHSIKVEQISNFIGGWNSQQRNNGAVRFRKYGEQAWTRITADRLKYN